MSNRGKRTYQSLVRQRQAGDTRRRIIEAAHQLLERAGYAGMTIEAIGRQAGVSVPTVYAIFKSKTGILRELLDQSTFGADYEKTVQQALNAREPAARLRFVARLARQIHEVQSATFDLLRGAGVVAPALAKLEQHRERVRYERQEPMINSLRDAGRLRPGLITARPAISYGCLPEGTCIGCWFASAVGPLRNMNPGWLPHWCVP